VKKQQYFHSASFSPSSYIYVSHFQKVNTKSSGDQIEPPNASRLFIPDFDRDISVAEMEEVFHKLKENKAPGDGIPPGVLAFLFNDVMRSGEYPNCWSTGIICPIHESGPKQLLRDNTPKCNRQADHSYPM